MIAKLVTHARSRAAAMRRSEPRSIHLHGWHPAAFRSSRAEDRRAGARAIFPRFISEEFREGFAVRAPRRRDRAAAGGSGAAIDHAHGERKRQISGQMIGRRVKRATPPRRIAGAPRNCARHYSRSRRAHGSFVGADGTVGHPHHLVSSWGSGTSVWQGTLDGHPVAMQVRPIANGFRLAHQGVEVGFHVFTDAEATAAPLMPVTTAADTGKKLLCPMPGLVVSIAVSEDQEVKAGETLAVMETMKMQNVLRADAMAP